jgi:hypothetical protein
MRASLFALIVTLIGAGTVQAAPGDWPEPRQNPHLTALQPLAGTMTTAPRPIARFDLGRSRPGITAAKSDDGSEELGLCIVSGALRCYDTAGTLCWESHPAGLNFTTVSTVADLDGDGKTEILLKAGRPAEPFAAAVLISLADGSVAWRYDVEPMSYSWSLHTGRFVPGTTTDQIVVIMQGYPPDKDNGYIVLFEYPAAGQTPRQRWRYDFDAYTCFPSFLQSDLDGDGTKELVVETHSRMWFLDAATGDLKHFAKWDVSPGNVRSYGLIQFVDLNDDGRDDFLCIGNFAQHHEVLLNRDGAMEKAWHFGWGESVTTGKVATTWPEPPYADIDGDGGLEVVVSMFNSEGNGEWLVRVYDALTGEWKYRFPGVVAASCVDVDGDGRAEILCNATDDSTRAVLKGARLLEVTAGALAIAWQDDQAVALPDPRGAGRQRHSGASETAEALVQRDGATSALHKDSGEAIRLDSWTPPPPVPQPDFSAVPAVQGPSMPAVLAADVDGNGTNQLILFQEPRARVLRYENGGLNPAVEYQSSALPVCADLDGDGKPELVLTTVGPGAEPVVEAITPALDGQRLWRSQFPKPDRTGLPQPRRAYVRTIRLTGKTTPDLYVWAGTPVVRSVGLDGRTGALLWDKGEASAQRYWGPSVNFASACDFNQDGKEDLVFTNPDYYCVADGPTGSLLLGPLFPPDIFKQPSQGLYTYPAILDMTDRDPTVCLVAGHYFQAGMSLHAEPYWYALPPTGENRSGMEAFLRDGQGSWLMGFGRQNGRFACVDASTGKVRWELPVEATCSDVAAGDVDGDGRFEFVFGTSHGEVYAVGDGGDHARLLWRVEGASGFGPPVLADLDGDGAIEIICASTDGYVTVFGAE